MVDKERRKKLALHLRHLTVGQITNDDFEERITEEVSFGWLPEQYYRAKEAKSDDPIIRPMLELSWCLYSDLERHKLTGGRKLADKQLKDIARFILFLHSDFEYEWPYIDPTNPLIHFSFKELLLSVLTLGKYYRDKSKEREQHDGNNNNDRKGRDGKKPRKPDEEEMLANFSTASSSKGTFAELFSVCFGLFSISSTKTSESGNDQTVKLIQSC